MNEENEREEDSLVSRKWWQLWAKSGLLESERMPEEWKRSVVIFKNKRDVQSCSDNRGIELLRHTMKIWEIV